MASQRSARRLPPHRRRDAAAPLLIFHGRGEFPPYGLLEPADLVVAVRLPLCRRKAAAVLPGQPDEEVELPRRQIDRILHQSRRAVIAVEMRKLLREVVVDRTFHEVEENSSNGLEKASREA
jgi:hypothetical protein